MKKPLFNKVCIVGVGLIGGSLGLAIKKKKIANFIVGVARRKTSAIGAVQAKAVDMATLDLKEGISGADLVILAGPIPAIISQIQRLSKYLNKNTIIIDVGSSKNSVGLAAKKYLPKNLFVGCHPMAGSEKTGVKYAHSGLFEGSACFVTKNNSKVNQLWERLGSKPILIEAIQHDKWVAHASHLPHILSFCLFQDIERKYPLNPSIKEFERLATSSPDLWADIFLSNAKEILKTSADFRKNLMQFEKNLSLKNKSKLVQLIQNANKKASA